MKRIVFDLAMLVTCVIAAAVNLWIARNWGFNVFGFTLWLIIPVGAIIVGMLAASGAFLAARLLHVRPTTLQSLVSSVVIGTATMALIYYLDYQALTVRGVRVREAIDFWSYLDLVLTKTSIRSMKGADMAPPGGLGYLLALIKLAGFVIGSFIIFAFIGALTVCWRCGAYMSSLRSRTTTDLPIEEGVVVHRNFLTGNIPAMQQALAWPPSRRRVPSDAPRSRLVFTWCACPKCDARSIMINLLVAKGGSFSDAKGFKLGRRIVDEAELAAVFPDKVPT